MAHRGVCRGTHWKKLAVRRTAAVFFRSRVSQIKKLRINLNVWTNTQERNILFTEGLMVGDYEPPSYCPGTFVDSRAYAVHHDSHSIVVNAEIISRCNWEERVAIPPCFVPSFSELLHLYMVVSQLPEGTKCQKASCKPDISLCFTLKKGKLLPI